MVSMTNHDESDRQAIERINTLRHRHDIIYRNRPMDGSRSMRGDRISRRLCRQMAIALCAVNSPRITPDEAEWALERMILDGGALWYLCNHGTAVWG